MTALSLDAHYHTLVQLDACHGCQALWVDQRESLRLTPGSTLRLFERIHDRAGAPRLPLSARLECARCGLRLLDTHDRQREAVFRYWRCGRGHGRFITFFDFLREKSFIRPLTPAQLAELKAQVRSVNCSNCGAPVDLAAATTCGYCRTPLSMLDFGQVERMLGSLRDAEQQRVEKEAQRATLEATLPLALARERRQVEQFFARIEQQPEWRWSASGDLVAGGIGAVVTLLRGLGR
jgi:hypothetical protein